MDFSTEDLKALFSAFAARMQDLIDFDPGDVPSAAQAAETEAWAARMRARATPPPRPR